MQEFAIRKYCLPLLALAAVAPAEAADAPFIEAGAIVREMDEASILSPDQRAYLAQIRSRPAVVRVTVSACNLRAFLSSSVSVDLPNGRSITLTRTRQEINQAAEPGGGKPGADPMTLWVGKTDYGSDAMFSIGTRGGLSGLFDDEGQKFEFQALDATRCIVIQDDPRKFPRDD